MRRTYFRFAAACLAAVAVGFLTAGCETESASGNLVKISPTTTELAHRQSQQFTATGAETYTGSLSDGSLGVLSSTTGQTVTYTSLYEGGTGSVTVVLSVSGQLGGGLSGTNTTVYSADATIVHLP